MKLRKYFFRVLDVKVLDHVVSKEGIITNPSKIECIKDARVPQLKRSYIHF